jgi:hypothetical protein
VVAAPFVVACGVEMARGWAPQGDDGAIVFRSWLELSSHPPLVGQLTHVTSRHAVFDPGPMLFWLLTIPVHLDHLQGGLWGATLLCVVGVCLAVEAAWSALGWPAAVAVATIVVVMVAEFPALALDPTWNAHMGTVWFVPTAAIAWAVAVGRLQWWPVLVAAASFATQCHLMFAIGSLSCVILAPIVGMTRRRRISWWLPTGILIGVVCWTAPLVQQFTSHPGNLSLLLESQEHTGPATGITFGLRAFAASVGPHPIWWGRGQVSMINFFAIVDGVRSHPAWMGVAVLVGLGLCAVIASVTKRRELAALAIVVLVLSLAWVWTLASLPTSQLLSFPYIDPGSWSVGMAVLLIAGCSLGELAIAAVRRLRQRRTGPGRRHRFRAPGWMAAVPVAVALSVITAGSALVVHASASNTDPTEGWPAMRQVRVATDRIERAVPRGRLAVLPSPGVTADSAVIAGVDWLLYSDGWRPESFPGYPTLIGPEVAPTTPTPLVTVTVDYNGGPVKVSISRRGTMKLPMATG